MRLQDVETVRAACESRRQREKRQWAARDTNRALIRDMRQRLREVEQFLGMASEV